MDWKTLGTMVMQVLLVGVYIIYSIVESIVRFFLPRDYLKKDIKDQVVLVTGGGSGIGRLMCLNFAAKGAKVVTWDVNTDGNKETVRLVQAEGGQCQGYTVDLCDRKDIYSTAARVIKEVGKVDILINNAGIVTGKSLLNSPDDAIIRTFEVNSLSHFWTVKAFLGDMILSNRGHIVTVASLAGWIGCNNMVDYCSSKFAAVGFDESLRMELQSQGATEVKTTVICPAFISTGMFEGIKSRVELSPDWVASEIVDATLMDVPVLMLPKHTRLAVIMKLIIPHKAWFKLATVTGLTTMMSGFKGRTKED